MVQQPFVFRKEKKKFKKNCPEVAEQIQAKLYTYDGKSMRNKRFTYIYDIIGHMVWQPYWIYPKTYKKKSSLEWLDRSRGNFTRMFPKPWV